MVGRASPPSPTSSTDHLVPRLALFAAWLAVLVVLSANHAFWRDEVRALSIAIRGEGLVDMLRGLNGEGHPALWYLLLRAAHLVLRDAVVLPAVSVLVASAAVLILLLWSPFRLPLVVALILGKFALFEYSVTARNYGISMLLLFALAMLYPRHRDRGVVLGLLLFLLVNTNAHSVLLAAAFLLFWLVELAWEHGLRWTPALRTFALNACLLALGVALCAATVYPPFNDAALIDAPAVTRRQVFEAVTQPARSFDALVLRGPWQALGLGPLHEFRHAAELQWLASLAMFGSLLGLMRRPAALLAGLASLLSLSLFFTVVYPGYYRHQALWLVFLVTLYWIALHGGPKEASTATWRFGPLSRVASNIGSCLFALLVALQVPGGTEAIADVALRRPPYSRSRDLAALVSSRPDLAGATIMADPDFLVEALPYYLDNRTYLIRENRFGSVARFTANARLRLTLDDILVKARMIAVETGKPVLILLAERLDASAPARVVKEGYNWELATTPGQVAAFQAATRLLAKFEPAHTDESFDVYLLEAIGPQAKEDHGNAAG